MCAFCAGAATVTTASLYLKSQLGPCMIDGLEGFGFKLRHFSQSKPCRSLYCERPRHPACPILHPKTTRREHLQRGVAARVASRATNPSLARERYVCVLGTNHPSICHHHGPCSTDK